MTPHRQRFHSLTLAFVVAASLAPSSRVVAQAQSAAQSTSPAPVSATQPTTPTMPLDPWEGKLSDIVLTEDKSQLRIKNYPTHPGLTVEVKDRGLREKLTSKDRDPSDILHFEFTLTGTTVTLDDVRPAVQTVASGPRILALLLGEVLLLAVCRLFVGKNMAALILGEDNRYSKSKFQMAVWFSVVIATYAAATALRLISSHSLVGGIDIPSHLLLLSGLSAFSFAAAKGITTASQQKAQSALAAGKRDAPPLKSPNLSAPSFPSDLIVDDNRRPDLGDFQMIVVTCLAVVAYLAAAYRFLGSLPLTAQVTLPDVDTTILATFGLGQGAYLAKKAVSQ